MKLTLLPADQGDCLLVTGADDTHVLVDGGMSSSYREHAAAVITALPRLDLVCVSHIDSDHIGGVLRLMDDLIDWRVHDYQVESGNHRHRVPESLRPPEIRGIWHNAFDEQVGEPAGPIATMLATSAAILSGADDEESREVAAKERDLVASVGQGIRLSQQVSAEQLAIPVNEGGGLIFVDEDQAPAPVHLGGLSISVIGPSRRELDRLQKKWDEWLKKNVEALDSIRASAARDADRLGQSDLDRVLQPLLEQARVFGRRASVTVPNLASIMLLVEEGSTRMLLTGDGHSDDILEGLRHIGRLGASDGMHVDVLKVQHHGSEHNIDPEFCRRITADHYVFSANGAHHNPDLGVVEMIIDSRIGPADRRSANREADGPFTLWFNSSSSIEEGERREQMREVERLMEARRAHDEDLFDAVFRGRPTLRPPELIVLG